MDDRRGFIGRLLTFCGVAAVAPKVIALPSSKRDEGTFLSYEPALVELKRATGFVPNKFFFRGFTFWWTGWKGCENSDVQVCQWCACEGPLKYAPGYDRRLFYASYPGFEGRYIPGAIFDISIKEGQEIPMWNTSEKEKERYRLECLQRLMAVIDKNVSVA
jgi:hypothetical protein